MSRPVKIVVSALAVALALSVARYLPSPAAAQSSAQVAGTLEMITDEATGVRVGLPVRMLGSPRKTSTGHNWKTSDGRLDIDTLRFRDKSLSSLYETLRGRRGRTISRAELDAGRFVLEGTESDGTYFHVLARAQSGEVRGLSIVYSKRARNEVSGIVDAMIGSFDPFPGSTAIVARREPEVRPEPAPQPPRQLARDPPRETVREPPREVPREPPREPSNTVLPRGKGVALAVGLNAYPKLDSQSQLRTAVNDVSAIGGVFRALGFEVMEGRNLTRSEFYLLWSRFLDRVQPGGVAAFFFAGHGVQFGGLNYLLPGDTPSLEAVQEIALKRVSINFDELREDLQERRASLNLFILDACRNNPYRGSNTRSLGRTRGLAATAGIAAGTFVMYSAEAGEEALDKLPGESDSTTSVYTRSLVPLLRVGDLPLQAIALRVRDTVGELVDKVPHSQWPAYYDGLRGANVCLVPPCSRSAQAMGQK